VHAAFHVAIVGGVLIVHGVLIDPAIVSVLATVENLRLLWLRCYCHCQHYPVYTCKNFM
jgi:hypothetical protein